MEELWSYLSHCGKPIVMWGMGDGADKILRVCDEKGIEISDFFASDGFVRHQLFHGKTVLSLDEIRTGYGGGNFVILLAFGSSLPEVIRNVETVAAENELLVPDVPVAAGSPLFDESFIREHTGEFNAARSLLADDASRAVFDTLIEAKRTGSLSLIRSTSSDASLPFADILHPAAYRTAVDLGAYTGDTVLSLAEKAPRLSRVYAVEPDRRTFKKVFALAEAPHTYTVIPVHAAAWSSRTVLPFSAAGGRGASLSSAKRLETVETVTVDDLVGSERVDYIKYDVEGAEREALLGSRAVIARDAPELLVSAYHRSEDLYDLPLLLHSLQPDYKIYLRRHGGFPSWDVNLYCAK